MRNKNFRALPVMELIMFLFLVILKPNKVFSSAQANNLETYKNYVEKPESLTTVATEDLHDWYRSFLQVVSMEDETCSTQKPSMVYSCRRVPGFAPRLTSEQVKAMENKDEILSVRNERNLTLQTTHSPQFLGLNKDKGFWKDSGEQELKYPSFSLLMLFNDTSDFTTFKRVVTNVGQARSSYTVAVDPPKGMSVVVKPEKWSFTRLKQKAKLFTHIC